MQIIPIRDLKNTVEIEKKCDESNEPVFITKNGRGRLVIMNIELFNKLFYELYEAKEVNQGLDDLMNNRVVEGKKALQQIRQKHERT